MDGYQLLNAKDTLKKLRTAMRAGMTPESYAEAKVNLDAVDKKLRSEIAKWKRETAHKLGF